MPAPTGLLDTIQAHEPVLNAVVHLDPEPAASLRTGTADRPVVVVKDNIAVRGAPWGCGSATRRDEPPARRDAEVVRRLREAGAVVLGTTNMDEFAMGASTESSAWGPTRNPWDPSRGPGGSSGGSAAAASAYGVLALGTDTGGSIREPAAECGVVGVKPTTGAVPVDGVVPFARSLDTVGPLAPDTVGAGWVHDVVAGTHGSMSDAAAEGRRAPDLRGHTIGVVTQMAGDRNAVEVVDRFEAACRLLRELGAELAPVSLPGTADVLRAYFTLSSVEALLVLESHALMPGMGPEAVSRLTHGRSLLGTAAAEDARAVQYQIRNDLSAAFEHCDLLVSPTMPLVAPPLGRPGLDDPLAIPRTDWWTAEANLAGIPAMSLPCGLGDETGLPVGLQVLAPRDHDAELYRLGGAYEAAGPGVLRPRLG